MRGVKRAVLSAGSAQILDMSQRDRSGAVERISPDSMTACVALDDGAQTMPWPRTLKAARRQWAGSSSACEQLDGGPTSAQCASEDTERTVGRLHELLT